MTARRDPGLDLMRAAAILLVLLSHWANNIGQWFETPVPQRVFFAGDLGVELFFALSGFLIGRILIGLGSNGAGWRDLRTFLIRRWMRTLPVYVLWLALLLLALPPKRDALAIAARFLTLTQNLAVPMPPDNFFAVTWSLTVEEWFYLLFASAFLASARAIGVSRALSLCLTVFIAVPLAARLAWMDWSPHAADLNKQVFFRVDEIALGVLMSWYSVRNAWMFRHPWPPFAVGLSAVGLAWVGWLPLPVALWPALTEPVTTAGCALCLPAALRLTHPPAWLDAPVRWIAARSYALYIVHLTFLANLAQGLFSHGWLTAPMAAALAIVAPFVTADLSYRFVETPILRRRPRQ